MTKRRDLQGVFAVEPLLRTWKYDGPELQGQYINVKRRQVPLAPARVLPLYSMQGMTASPGLVAHWALPARVASDINWLICYVTLSRVPSLKQLVSIGLSDQIRDVLESGPPESLVQIFLPCLHKKFKTLDWLPSKRKSASAGEPASQCTSVVLLSLHDVISSAVQPESILQLEPSAGNAVKLTCHGTV